MREDDLILTDFQYLIRHTTVDDFKVGERVFLKSNPEFPMTVYSFDDGEIACEWVAKNSIRNYHFFPPESILQYEYAGLVVFRKLYHMCLN